MKEIDFDPVGLRAFMKYNPDGKNLKSSFDNFSDGSYEFSNLPTLLNKYSLLGTTNEETVNSLLTGLG